MTGEKSAKLVRMANQIGAFYAAMPDREATVGAVSHLRAFWTPKMIDELLAFTAQGDAGLNPTTAHAVEALRRARPA